MSFRACLALASVVSLLGCGESHAPLPGDDGGSSVDAPSSTDAPVAGDAPVIDDAPMADDAPSPCAYADTIDRSCTVDGDCLVRLHQTDCCGNSVMLGINAGAESVYLAGEPACQASYPGCGCPAMLPTTDSGETVTDTSLVQVACVSRGPGNVCLTYVTMRPLPGR